MFASFEDFNAVPSQNSFILDLAEIWIRLEDLDFSVEGLDLDLV